MASIRSRLVRLEDKRRFLHWFVMDQLFNTLTADELETFAAGGNLPETLLNRPSKLDKLDRKSLIKRWKEADRILGGRSREELECYAKSGLWPEQRGWLHYSMMANGAKGGTSGGRNNNPAASNMKARFKSEEQMSVPNKNNEKYWVE